MKRKTFLSIMALSSVAPLSALREISEQLPETGDLMPVLFVGHGSPMNAIEDNEFSQRWRQMGKEMPRPKAVLCVSAHWLTTGTKITAMQKPQTIHDFGGFPQALFDAQYPAPGNPDLAQETQQLITKTPVALDHDWGLDHGTWSITKQMYPDADIPVLQLSIDYNKPGQYHYELGQQLAGLRRKGVLIIGSGNMVHNLRIMSMRPATAGQPADFNAAYGFDWAIEINEVFKKHIAERNHVPLMQYQTLHKASALAIPTPDHYFPLLYILGLQGKGETATFFNDKAVAGSITMTSVRIG